MKKLKTIIIIIHVLVIGGCVIWLPFFRQHQFMGIYQNPQDSIFCATGEWNAEREVYYVDEQNGNEGIFTCGPYLDLKKGVYEITIYYKSTGGNHVCYAYDDDAHTFARALYGNQAVLDSEHTMKQFTFWVNKPMHYFEVRTEYAGTGSLEVNQIVVRETMQTYLRTVFGWLCLLLLMDGALALYSLFNRKKIGKKQLTTALILCGIIILSSVPFLTDGILTVVDRNTIGDNNIHLMRIVGLAEGLKDGHFPVYIHPEWLNGYGYAMPIFYGDLFLYLPAILLLVGFPLFWVYNFYLICINLATCLIAFFCYKGMFKSHNIALLCSAISTCSVYRLTTMVNYESLGVFTSFAFLPLVAYGLYLIYYEAASYKSWMIMALGMTNLLNSHLLTTEITVMALAITIAGSYKVFCKKESILAMGKAVLCSVLLNLGFLIPMLTYMRKDLYVTSDNWSVESWQNRGPGVAEHLILFPGGATERKIDFMIVCALALFILLLLQIAGTHIDEIAQKYRKMGILTAALLILFTWMSTSYFPWDWIYVHLPWTHWLTSSIQEPMRFAQLAELFGIVMLGCMLVIIKQTDLVRWKQYFAVVMIFISLISFESVASDYIRNGTTWKVYDAVALDTCNIGTKEYLPADADVQLFNKEFVTVAENVLIVNYEKRGTDIAFTGQNLNETETRIQLPLVYYWNYQAVDENGINLLTECSEEKTLQVVLPAEYYGNIKVSFQVPVSWRISKWISVLSAVLLFYGYNRNRKRLK